MHARLPMTTYCCKVGVSSQASPTAPLLKEGAYCRACHFAEEEVSPFAAILLWRPSHQPKESQSFTVGVAGELAEGRRSPPVPAIRSPAKKKCGSSPCWSSCRSEVPFNPCRYQNLALLILRVSLVILPSHRETLLSRDVIVTNYYLCQCNSPRPDRITMREFGKLFIGLAKLDYHSGSRSQP